MQGRKTSHESGAHIATYSTSMGPALREAA